MRNTKKASLGGDAIKLTTSKILTMMITLITSMLLSRFRTLEEYGTYSQILLVVNLMTSLIMLGLPNSLNFFLSRAETDSERQKFLSVYYSFSTILSILVGLVLVLSTPLIVLYFDNELIRSFIYVLAVYPWAKIIMSSIENVLIVYQRASLIMIYRVSNSISLLCIIILVQFFNWGFQEYMILFTLLEAIFAISVYIIIRGIAGKITISFDIHLIKTILSFSIPIGLATSVGTLNIELDKLMIGKFLNTEQLAIYTNASKEMPVTIVASSLTAVLLPQLARLLKDDENQKAINLWGNATTLSYIIICFLAAGFFTFAPDVMTLLYSEKYLSGVSVFRVYNIVLLLRCTYFGMILNAKGNTKFIFFSSIISLILNIILNPILFNIIGFIGPAIATFLSQLIVNYIQLNFTASTINIRFSKIFPWRRLGFITVINILLALIFYQLKNSMKFDRVVGSLFESILLGILWGVIYLIIMRKEIKKQWLELNK